MDLIYRTLNRYPLHMCQLLLVWFSRIMVKNVYVTLAVLFLQRSVIQSCIAFAAFLSVAPIIILWHASCPWVFLLASLASYFFSLSVKWNETSSLDWSGQPVDWHDNFELNLTFMFQVNWFIMKIFFSWRIKHLMMIINLSPCPKDVFWTPET